MILSERYGLGTTRILKIPHLHIRLGGNGIWNQVVKEIKIVPELGFRMETQYFWDYELKRIRYLSLVNKAMISKGTVLVSENKIEKTGMTFFEGGNEQNRTTYEINENGALIDLFIRKSNQSWIQGHRIVYRAQTGEQLWHYYSIPTRLFGWW